MRFSAHFDHKTYNSIYQIFFRRFPINSKPTLRVEAAVTPPQTHNHLLAGAAPDAAFSPRAVARMAASQPLPAAHAGAPREDSRGRRGESRGAYSRAGSRGRAYVRGDSREFHRKGKGQVARGSRIRKPGLRAEAGFMDV